MKLVPSNTKKPVLPVRNPSPGSTSTDLQTRRSIPQVGSIREFYEMGQAFLKSTGGCRSVGAAQNAADGWKYSEVTMYKARQFARLYSAKDFEELARLRLPDGRPLGIGHVYELVQIRSRPARMRLQRQAAKRGWSCRELKKHRKQEFGYSVTTNLGRKPIPPVNREEAVLNISQYADRWLRWATELQRTDAETNEAVFDLQELPASITKRLRTATAAVRDLADALARYQRS